MSPLMEPRKDTQPYTPKILYTFAVKSTSDMQFKFKYETKISANNTNL